MQSISDSDRTLSSVLQTKESFSARDAACYLIFGSDYPKMRATHVLTYLCWIWKQKSDETCFCWKKNGHYSDHAGIQNRQFEHCLQCLNVEPEDPIDAVSHASANCAQARTETQTGPSVVYVSVKDEMKKNCCYCEHLLKTCCDLRQMMPCFLTLKSD